MSKGLYLVRLPPTEKLKVRGYSQMYHAGWTQGHSEASATTNFIFDECDRVGLDSSQARLIAGEIRKMVGKGLERCAYLYPDVQIKNGDREEISAGREYAFFEEIARKFGRDAVVDADIKFGRKLISEANLRPRDKVR